MTPDETRALLERVITWSSADDTTATLTVDHTAHTRFAANTVTTAGLVANRSLTIECAFGRRHAASTTTRVDEPSLRQTLASAEALARLAPEDPEFMGSVEPAATPQIVSREAAETTPETRAAAVASAIQAARAAGDDLVAAGFLMAGGTSFSIANKRGLFSHVHLPVGRLSSTVRTKDGTGSGWAGAGFVKAADLDAAALGRRAAEKAARSRAPRPLPPGRYPVVLEPACVAMLLRWFTQTLDARSAEEGRSPFSRPGGRTMLQEEIADRKVTIYSDPAEERLRGYPFDQEGLPLGRQTWIDQGRLKTLSYSRYWAARRGVAVTGHAGTLAMTGGQKSVDELIQSLDKGLLITRLSYVNFIDPKTVTFTGLTRDGLFWVEKGRIVHPVKNFRFNQSMLELLKNVQELSIPQIVAGDFTFAGTGEVALVPALRASSFQLASPSDAV